MTFFDLFRSFYESWRFNPTRKHDERLGQRLFNEIRNKSNITINKSIWTGEAQIVDYQKRMDHHIAETLWNMPDKAFMEYLERFFE